MSSCKRMKLSYESTGERQDLNTLGRLLQLRTNHYKIELSSHYSSIYRYHVKILNSDKSKNGARLIRKLKQIWYQANYEIINSLVDTNSSSGQQFYDDMYQTKIPHAFDGKENLYSYRKLRQDEFNTTLSYNLDRFELKLNVQLKLSGELRLDQFQRFFNGAKDENLNDLVKALETILKDGPTSKGIPTEQGIFPKLEEEEIIEDTDCRRIDQNMKGLLKKAIFGHTQTIQVMNTQLNLVVDRAVHAFYISEKLDQALVNILIERTDDNQHQMNTARILFSSADQANRQQYTNQLNRELKGLKIETTHLNYPRKFKVFELTFKPVRDLSFKDKKTGRIWKITDYFKETYDIELNGSLPCLNVGNKKNPIYLPLEVCKIGLNQKVMRLKPEEETNLSKFSVNQKIENRFELIAEKMKLIKDMSEERFSDLIHLNENPIEVDAVQMFNPKLKYQNVYNFQPNYGKWKMKGKKLFDAKELKRHELCIVNLTENLFLNQIDEFMKHLMAKSVELGIRIEEPFNFNRNSINSRNSFFCEKSEQLREVIDELIKLRSPFKPKMIMFFIGKQRGDRIYKNIKSECEINYGLTTQCITEQSVHKILNYFSKPPSPTGLFKTEKSNFQLKDNGDYILDTFLLKVNSKLGGVNCTVNAELNEISKLNGNLMLIGADVTHPAQSDSFNYSICSVVATIDTNHFKYISVVRIQDANSEIIKQMKEITIELLDLFVRNKLEESKNSIGGLSISKNDSNSIYNLLPKHIIYYRDGISESQHGQFEEIEIQSMYSAFEEFSKQNNFREMYRPKMNTIFVLKRHTTRFKKLNNEDLNTYDSFSCGLSSIGQLSSFDYLNLSEQERAIVDEDSEPIKTFNIDPGTLVVDKKVVRTGREFYLCSHNCDFGTIRSTHYLVHKNESEFQMTEIQRFTYDLCYLFGKGTKSISIPTPVKYAHLAAYRARNHLIHYEDNKKNQFQQQQSTSTFQHPTSPFYPFSVSHLGPSTSTFNQYQPFQMQPSIQPQQSFGRDNKANKSSNRDDNKKSKPSSNPRDKKPVVITEELQSKIKVKDDLKLSFYFL